MHIMNTHYLSGYLSGKVCRKPLNDRTPGRVRVVFPKRSLLALHVGVDGRTQTYAWNLQTFFCYTEKIVKKAIEANITTAEQAKNISSRKLLGFLFHEGLSTTDETDEDSGRGVGMNLIAEKTKEINGKIHIKTNAQTGTTFTINIPPLESTQITHEHQLSA